VLTIEHHSSEKLVRAPGIAPGTADWRTATLLLRHARTGKLGPCRAWAAGWLHRDPIGRSGLRPRIENRRFLKEMAALTGVAPASRGLKGRDPELLDDKAEKRERAAGIAV
jgi:hypothetical protein